MLKDSLYQESTLKELKNRRSNHSSINMAQQLKKHLVKLDEENDSEDEGIEDYNIGGYHPVHIGEVLNNRYVVIQKLGWGHFSTVWLCKDFKYKTYVAVKIQKSSPHYMEAAFDQVQILQKVQQKSHDKQWGKRRDQSHVVGLLNAFIYKTYNGNHFCMVFQILSCNLLDVIKRYNYEGLPLNLCQEISRQVLKGLDFLHRVCGVIHTDLKPQNVMVCLSDEQLKQIVQNGQLVNGQLFSERIKIIQKTLGFTQHQTKITHSNKINLLQQKLKNQSLSKNQKNTLKKKLKKELQNQHTQHNENYSSSENIELGYRIDELFDLKKGKISFNRSNKLSTPFRIKIADLGNACWKHHHFSSQIQTRQYRSPEVILGQTYNQTADLWSFGCMIYEMLTGDLLFHPSKGQTWSKNQDHLAQIQEIVGPFHPHFIARSPKRNKYFQKDGTMKHYPNLSFYPLNMLLQIKNQIKEEQANQFAYFLLQTLIHEPEKRISAQNALKLPWLQRKIPENYKMEERQYQLLRQKFNENQQWFQNNFQIGHESEPVDQRKWEQQEQNDQNDGSRIADFRLIDRSFTDLGYIGYSQGISLSQLDVRGNWQFSQ